MKLKLLCKNPGQRLVSLRKVGIVVATFLVEYVVAVGVVWDLIEVVVAADADDLVSGVTSAAVVVCGLVNVVFDDDYIVACVAVDIVVVAGFVVVFVVVAVDDAGVPPVAHADA